jgi:ATP-dependent Lhr-like helicase
MPFQLEAWGAYADGDSGLVHVPTGAGKTYAATLAPLFAGHSLVYIAPLRAMARDIERALRLAVEENALCATVAARTGDASTAERARQRRQPPTVLITTPESLSLVLTQADARERFATLGAVVVDEWHELIDSKRGTQVELALARLRGFSPGLRTWALSATLGNPQEAAVAACGTGSSPRVITAELPRPVVIEALLPGDVDLPFAGHLGVVMADRLVAALDPAHPTLVFCNTRFQCERWFQEIVVRRPEWFEVMALHHGSVDRSERARVEAGLKSGAVRIVVCTASLDLGVDLAPVERVVQVGSPKGIARMIQRAGRSGHRPGETARLLAVPTHALQLVEIAAVREALRRGSVEPRSPLQKPIDVLAQHLVTCALGGGFTRDAMLAEVRGAYSYASISDEEFDQAVALVAEGGTALRAYPSFRKVARDGDRWTVTDEAIAKQHRASVGTIVGDAVVRLRAVGLGDLGTIDEYFVARLSKGERFVFAGKTLEFMMLRDMTAYARISPRRSGNTPHWPGTKLPISGSLGEAVRQVLGDVRLARLPVRVAGVRGARRRIAAHAELAAAVGIFDLQSTLSRLPSPGALLAEACAGDDGHHLFLYPFEGRRVHEGLAALLALRIGRVFSATFQLSVNDYGLELIAPEPLPWGELLVPAIFSRRNLVEDILESVNLSELMRRRFREVARVAGLVHPGRPGQPKPMRQVHASASLLFDVLQRHEPGSPLLGQARREVLEQSFEQDRLAAVLDRLAAGSVELVEVRHPTPLAFPLLLERFATDSSSSESLQARVERIQAAWTSA